MGQQLPEDVQPMPLLTEDELKTFPEPTTDQVIPGFIARYWDLMALSDHQPARVIAADGVLQDRPGFEVEFLSRGSIPDAPYVTDRHEVLMPVRGHWRLGWDGGSTVLNPGDTVAVPPGLPRRLAPSMTGESALYRIRNTDDPAGLTRRLA
jgi:mannose-6-phosphate isomerase-like protein (cupin superfamily)